MAVITEHKLRKVKLVDITKHNVDGSESIAYKAKEIRGKLLVERSWFIENLADSSYQLDRLVNKGEINSYMSNGKRKETTNGKKPSGKTYYDLNEWLEATI